jgi:hypothetical protein
LSRATGIEFGRKSLEAGEVPCLLVSRSRYIYIPGRIQRHAEGFLAAPQVNGLERQSSAQAVVSGNEKVLSKNRRLLGQLAVGIADQGRVARSVDRDAARTVVPVRAELVRPKTRTAGIELGDEYIEPPRLPDESTATP